MRPKPIADPHGPSGLRAGYHWSYDQCPGTSTEDLMRAPYERARGLSRWPDRMRDGRKAVTCRDGIGTSMAKTFANKRAQEAYALRVELGDKAYAELTGSRVRTRTKAAKRTKRTKSNAEAQAVRRSREMPRSSADEPESRRS